MNAALSCSDPDQIDVQVAWVLLCKSQQHAGGVMILPLMLTTASYSELYMPCFSAHAAGTFWDLLRLLRGCVHGRRNDS